ncbi:5239_t:CDS:2, partial [Racocetra persica]
MLSQAGRPVSPQAFKFLQDTIAGEVKVIYEPGEHDLAEFDGVKDLATANIEVDIDLEQEKKETESNPSTSKGENLGSGSKSVSSPRTIILIGGVRSGKSALANVLAGQELFKESLKSSSIGNREAREGEFVRETEQGEKITYRLVEIPDFFEAMVDEESKKQVENKLQEELAKGDINQVFLLSRNKFTEIVPYYDYLMSNGMPIEYLTIIRTEYPNFENEAKVNEEKEILQNEDEKSKKIFSSVSLICVDNPPLSSGCLAEINKEVRQISQQKLFAHLANKNEFSPPIILEQPLISLVEKAEKLESEGLLYRPALLEKLMTAIQKNSKLATAEPGLASRVKKLNQKLVELTHTKDLKHLAENGYQPDDYLCFNQIVDRGKNSESSNSGRSIENQCQNVVKEIENKIREVGPGEYPQWPKKINEIIGVPQPQQEGMTTEQQIEEFIFMAADDEQARERTD